jgi:outer membrane lipopolysaccharide assembly protein LptE/RlpB
MTRWRALALVAALVGLAGGCGYSLRPSLPGNVKTVHIPTLQNRTQEPGVEDFVTRALTQALVTSGVAKIAPAETADAVLEGSIVEYSLTSLAFDRTSNVTQYRLQIGLSLELRNQRTGEVLWKQDRVQERADFPVAGQVTTTIAREEDAVRRAAIDISRAIISLAFEGF